MSLRDALARKRGRETHYDIPVVTSDEQEALEEQFSTARRALVTAEARHGMESPEAVAARASVEEARAALSEAVYRVRFRNLPPDEFEALVSAHPPTKEQQDEGDQWNRDTFTPALLAACAVESDMTEKDWIDELSKDSWSTADKMGIFVQALTANTVPRSVTVPKG